jgi:hypothetical protein
MDETKKRPLDARSTEVRLKRDFFGALLLSNAASNP